MTSIEWMVTHVLDLRPRVVLDVGGAWAPTLRPVLEPPTVYVGIWPDTAHVADGYDGVVVDDVRMMTRLPDADVVLLTLPSSMTVVDVERLWAKARYAAARAVFTVVDHDTWGRDTVMRLGGIVGLETGDRTGAYRADPL